MIKQERKTTSPFFNLFANFSFWWGLVTTSLTVPTVLISPENAIDGGFIFGFLIAGIAPLVTGHFMRKKIKQSRENEKFEFLERTALKAIEKNNGKISASQLSAQSSLSIDEANQALEQLAISGVLYPEPDDNGTVIFSCKELSN